MAKCRDCIALKEFPELSVIERYAFGDGCPDLDMDIYGGDCYEANWGFEDDGDMKYWDKFEEYYNLDEIKLSDSG